MAIKNYSYTNNPYSAQKKGYGPQGNGMAGSQTSDSVLNAAMQRKPEAQGFGGLAQAWQQAMNPQAQVLGGMMAGRPRTPSPGIPNGPLPTEPGLHYSMSMAANVDNPDPIAGPDFPRGGGGVPLPVGGGTTQVPPFGDATPPGGEGWWELNNPGPTKITNGTDTQPGSGSQSGGQLVVEGEDERWRASVANYNTFEEWYRDNHPQTFAAMTPEQAAAMEQQYRGIWAKYKTGGGANDQVGSQFGTGGKSRGAGGQQTAADVTKANDADMMARYNQFIAGDPNRKSVTFEQYKAHQATRPQGNDANDPNKYAAWARTAPGGLTKAITGTAVADYWKTFSGKQGAPGIDQWWTANKGKYLNPLTGGGVVPGTGAGSGSMPMPTGPNSGTNVPNSGTTGTSTGTGSGYHPPTSTGSSAGGGSHTTTATSDPNGNGPGFQPLDPNAPGFQSQIDLLRSYMAPAWQGEQSDLARQLRHEGSVTGAINSGGYGATFGKSMGDLINKQQSQLGQMAFASRESALDRALNQNQFQNQFELDKWVNQNKFALESKGIDAQRYAADQGYRASVAQANAQQSAAAMAAEASKYNANLDYQLGNSRLSYDDIFNKRAYDLGVFGVNRDIYLGDQNDRYKWAQLQWLMSPEARMGGQYPFGLPDPYAY